MEQLENELKTLKAQGVIAKPQKPTAQRATRSNVEVKHAFSMSKITKVLDNANKEDIKLLKGRWNDVIDHAKNNDRKSLVSLLQNSEPVAASETNVLVKFEEEIHCEIVNKESVVCEIINKNVQVVGVPSDQWLRVRSEYIQQRKNHNGEQHETQDESSQQTKTREQSQPTDVAQKARDLFGDETVHLVDEE